MMTLEQLNAIYEAADFGNNAKYSGSVAPMAVNNPAGLQTINIAQAPMVQPVTQSNGLDYLLNKSGNQNQNFSQEEYEKALANQNAKPQSNNFLSGIFSNVMDNKYIQAIRNFSPMGMLSNIASKADRFSSLPVDDQEFIKSQMGYTGPTVFGENTSGLSKDKYGINVRSMFGNYADYVEKDLVKVREALAKAKNKYTSEYGYFDKEKYNINTKFLQQKEIDRQEQIDEKNRQQVLREKEAAAKKEREIVARTSQAYYDRAVQTAAGRDPNQGNTVTGYGRSGLGRNPDDRMAKGGRIGYGTGGIVTL